MSTPTSDKMRFFFPSKYLGSDGATLTQQTADAGGTVQSIVDAALTEADDYWNGAVGWFDSNTTTVALRGVFFHVKDFTAASDTLTLATSLPAAPAAGDTYRLVLGGNYRSDTEGYFMELDGDLPELTTTTGTNITGLTITKASAKLGEGTLSVFYDFSADTLQIKMGADAYGATLDVSGDVTDGIIYGVDEQSYIQVDVTSASLPGSDQTDTFAVTYPTATFVPNYEAYETTADKTRYRLIVLKNTDGVNAMTDAEVWCGVQDGDATTVAVGETVGITAGSADLTDASTHPSGNYWLYNSDDDDLRYITTRTGNTITWADATGGLRGKTAASWSAGANVEVYPDFDIGLDAPATNQFENPTDEETAPSGVTYSAPSVVGDALLIGAIAASGIYGVWYRETIMADHTPGSNMIFDLHARWQ